jgi:hypothetical protein
VGELTKTESFSSISLEKSAELAAIAVAAAAKAEVESAYVMALKAPRNEDDAWVRMKKACGNPGFATKAKYRKPVGGKYVNGRWQPDHVVGPSIRFAEEALRCWRNVLTQVTTIYDDDSKRVVKIAVRDLESNISFSKEITLEKTVERKSDKDRIVIGSRKNSKGDPVYIVKATEDELLVKESAQVSKVIRTQGLRLIPQHIIDECMTEVDRVIREGIKKDPDAERRALLEGFGAKGILPTELERFMGVASVQWSADQLLQLREALTAIQDGHTTWGEFIEGTPQQQNQDISDKSQPATKGAEIAQQAAQQRPTMELPAQATSGGPEPPQQAAEPIKEPEKKEPAKGPSLTDQILALEVELMSSEEGIKAYRQAWDNFKLPPDAFGKNGAAQYVQANQLAFFLRQLKQAKPKGGKN